MAMRNGTRIDYRRGRQSQRENQYPHFAGALVIFDVKFSSLDDSVLRFPSCLYECANSWTRVASSNRIVVELRCSRVSARSPFLLLSGWDFIRRLSEARSLTGAFLTEASIYLLSIRQVVIWIEKTYRKITPEEIARSSNSTSVRRFLRCCQQRKVWVWLQYIVTYWWLIYCDTFF